MMLHISSCKIIIVFSLIIFSNCSSSNRYSPDSSLSEATQDSILQKIVRYSAKLPPHSNHLTKFNTEFDGYYERAFELYNMRYHFAKQDTHFFLLMRNARSLWPAHEALGCKLVTNSKGQIIEYEEIFRTWKMAEDSLAERGLFLFELMVQNEDLKPYYTSFQGDRYIEFPNDRFFFNKLTKTWQAKSDFID
jgi:hypothetical protein